MKSPLGIRSEAIISAPPYREAFTLPEKCCLRLNNKRIYNYFFPHILRARKNSLLQVKSKHVVLFLFHNFALHLFFVHYKRHIHGCCYLFLAVYFMITLVILAMNYRKMRRKNSNAVPTGISKTEEKKKCSVWNMSYIYIYIYIYICVPFFSKGPQGVVAII